MWKCISLTNYAMSTYLNLISDDTKVSSVTLLMPSIFSFVNIYICISFIMVSVSPFHDKKDIFALHGPSIEKTIYLALTNQSLLNFQPYRLWVLIQISTLLIVYCVLNHTNHFGTLTFTVNLSLPLCSHIFYTRLPSTYIRSKDTH